MKVLPIVGTDADAAADRIATRLARDGRVARLDLGRSGTDGGTLGVRQAHTTTVRIDEDGWSVHGDARTIDDALDRLAVDHDYALVVGMEPTDLATIHVGEAETDAVVSAPSSEAFDPEAVVDALDEFERRETLHSLVERVKDSPSADKAGAIATFTGRVREREHDDDAPTTHLEFETYDGVADRRMAEIETELEARDGVYEVRMHHRTGIVEAGEDIVFVVVLAGHRPEAFRAVEDGIDRLKDEVPIFKKEVTVDDEFWRHER